MEVVLIIILENDTDILLSRKDTIAATAKYFNLSSMSEFGKLWVKMFCRMKLIIFGNSKRLKIRRVDYAVL